MEERSRYIDILHSVYEELGALKSNYKSTLTGDLTPIDEDFFNLLDDFLEYTTGMHTEALEGIPREDFIQYYESVRQFVYMLSDRVKIPPKQLFEAVDITALEPDKITSSEVYVNPNARSDKKSQLHGGRKLTLEEINLHKAAGGGPTNYDAITIVDRKPTVNEVRNAGSGVGVDLSGYSDTEVQAIIDGVGAMSLPDNTIYMGNKSSDKPLVAHEIEHQSQYQNGNPKDIFERLVQEAQMVPPAPDPYVTPGHLEYEAQQVQKRAKLVLRSPK